MSDALPMTEGPRIALAALPFCHLNLKSPKPDGRYPIQLQRLGDHVRKRRLDLGLLQRDLARQLGADPKTILNWEKGRSEPRLRFLPLILAFLGEDPRPVPPTFGERLRRAREARGLSIAGLAHQLGVDRTTVWSWEKGRHQPAKAFRERVLGLTRYSWGV
jgi:transcriptional regulator with XRE-family HTH domain